MSFCSFSGGNALYGITPLENMFIIEYMPGAPAEYVKVYLYMLMLCSYPGDVDSLDDIARALKTDEQTVINALKHWEREGLIVKMSDNPPTYDFLPLSRKEQKESSVGDSVYQNRNFNRELQCLMPGLVIDSHELRMINDWQDVFNLTPDTILFIAGQEMAKHAGKTLPTVATVFKHLNTTAQELAANEATTLEKAQEYIAQKSIYSKTAETVLRQFGQRRSATRDEIALAEKWRTEWKYTDDDIISACAETVKSANPSFAYLDKILESRLKGETETVARSKVKTICLHLGILSRPTPAQIEAFEGFEKMGFEFAAIEQAAKWCGENNRRTFDDVKRKLEKWKAAGAFTVADIEEERSRQKRFLDMIDKIFETAGIDRKANASDLKFVQVWTALMSLDTVLIAAEASRGTETPMKYIDKLIRQWSASGITTPEKARVEAERFRSRADIKKPTDKPIITRDVQDETPDADYYNDIMNRKRPQSGE